MKAQIDQLILEVMEKEKIPAQSLSIVKKDGSLLYNRGYGDRDVEHNLPAGPETLFAIGSATKSFTAVLVAKTLHEMYPAMGKNVLDVPIRELAPGYNFTLGDRFRSERVTFKDILAHRVCIKQEVSGLVSQAFNGTEDMVNRFRYSPEECGFRSEFSYNNGLIGMAGHILGHIANTTYADLLSEFVGQLGMTSTTVIKMSNDHENMMHRAIPYIWKGGEFVRGNSEFLKSIAPIPSGGGILTNANDMAKYMLFHLNKGKVGDVQVVPDEVMG
ncbi:beta-lactamase-like protein 3 [Folsomia candida]|nr:beta-lactamase-like protein 3 [Folsomia candida]